MLIIDNYYNISLDTWIISDTHFFHKNIGRYCNRPEHWQELIIKNWNDRVEPDATVLHLGDFAFGKKRHFELLTEILNGKLLLIKGNHDRLSPMYYENHGATLIKESIRIEVGEHTKLVFTHRPLIPLENGWINLHGHIHNNPQPAESVCLSPRHINMSVEVRDYRPWRLREIIKEFL